MGEGSASGVPWGDGLGKGDWEGLGGGQGSTEQTASRFIHQYVIYTHRSWRHGLWLCHRRDVGMDFLLQVGAVIDLSRLEVYQVSC